MKAIVCSKYGLPEVLKLVETEIPIPARNEVLVKIHATAVTASDCVIRGLKVPGGHAFPLKQLMRFGMRLFIGFSKPRNPVLGLVFSGEIEATGKDINLFNKGDEVYGFSGLSRGAYAEYKCVSMKEITNGEVVRKPQNISHKEAAAIIYGGALAMHFMRRANIRERQKVLIYGASGAIGTIAIQLARYHGAEVTGVCSSGNFDLVKSLGATRVLDYTSENSINQLERYDFILDAVGKNKTSVLKEQIGKSLSSNGKYASVDDGLLKIRPDYLKTLNEMIKAGFIKGVIDKTYHLEDIVEAHRYVDKGHKKGNVIIKVSNSSKNN